MSEAQQMDVTRAQTISELSAVLGVDERQARNLVSTLQHRASNRLNGEMDTIIVTEQWWQGVWADEYGDAPTNRYLAARELSSSGDAWYIEGGAYILHPAFATDEPMLTDAFSTFDHSDGEYDADLGETYLPKSVVEEIVEVDIDD